MTMSQFVNSSIKRIKYLVISIVIAMITSCGQDSTIHIAVVTGGHAYDSVNFAEVFKSLEDVDYDHLIHPGANDIYGSDSIDKYDVLVFYDLYQDISERQKKAFLDMVNNGKGLVFLHHSIASYQDWDEFMQILGARYFLRDTLINGEHISGSTYSHDQEVSIEVVDGKHPVSKGIDAFTIFDEVYAGCSIVPGVKTLMTTDHPDSDGKEVWVNEYGNSRIVYIQMGHDNNAYSNPNFRQLLYQAINWTSK